MRNMFILAGNTLKIAFRKKANILVYLVLPVAVLLLVVSLSYGGNSKLNIGICNNDINGRLALDFISSIKSQSKYNVVPLKSEDIKARLTDGKVDCVITIPKDFDNKILNNTFDTLQITAIRGADATGWIQSYADYYIRNLLDMSKASSGNTKTFDKVYKSGKYLKINTTTLADEHNGKSVSQQGIGLITMFMLIGAAALIVAFSATSTQAGYLTTLITVPTSMLSGCFWPISEMPDFMQKLAYFFPQSWLLESIKRVQNTGNFNSALPCIGILLGFAAIFSLISIFRMKSNDSVNNFV